MRAVGAALLVLLMLSPPSALAQDAADKPTTPPAAETIVEGRPAETGKIDVVKAAEIQQALARDGRVAIYGIYFDVDKAELKAESQPQMEQIAVLLKNNPDLAVLIVGHTDGEGEFEHSLSLSQQRAQAVADALVAGFEIGASRLTPVGAGMMSPVATNRTGEGRAINRRIEIVEIYPGG